MRYIKKILSVFVSIDKLFLITSELLMVFAFSSFFDAILAGFQRREKILCFHCEESMRKDNALMAVFNGASHPVCCHGCLAVLQTIERNGLIQQYLAARAKPLEPASSS